MTPARLTLLLELLNEYEHEHAHPAHGAWIDKIRSGVTATRAIETAVTVGYHDDDLDMDARLNQWPGA